MKSFKLQCDEWAAALEEAPSKIVKEVATDLFERITSKTPIDTGYTVHNFQLTADAPATGTVGEKPTQHGKQVYDKPHAPELPDGTLVAYITNNTPEAELLENGRSDKQPLGMIAMSVAEVQNEFDVIASRALKK